MTKLLVSVTDADEALAAVENGADLIDVKNPNLGSLGAASPDVWRDVLTAVGERVPVSAALGELNSVAETAPETIGLTFAKVGLAKCKLQANWPLKWTKWRAGLDPATMAVAVIYVDWENCGAPSPSEIIERLVLSQRCGVMLFDTCDKAKGSLQSYFSPAALKPICEFIREAGAKVVLAGSLQLSDLTQLLPLQPDYVAVRGAVCRGDRTGRLDGALVREWASALR